MPIAPEHAEELRTLLGAARAYLELEEELGSAELRPAPAGEALSKSAAGAATRLPTQTTVAAVATGPAAQAPVAPAGRLSPEERRVQLTTLADAARTCTACELHVQRKQAVFARGNPEARLLFVGEGPGRDEDEQGSPFVGRAGQLLDKMVAAMGFGRDDVYICNVVKCRPPENRTPRPEESLACSKFLVPQVEAVGPEVIVALGRCAAQALGVAEAAGSWRGQWSSWQGVPVMPTYHPAFLLRSPEFKRTVWEDLQLVMKRLGIEPPAKRG